MVGNGPSSIESNYGQFSLAYRVLPSAPPELPAYLSCPLLALQLGEYWFRKSLYVYDRNRPLVPILRQKRCSLMYNVYLTCIDDDGSCITGLKYLEYSPGIELNIFLMNNEQ